MTFKAMIIILISVCLFGALPGPFGMLCAFFLMTKHTQNFVLQPLAKYLSAHGNSPINYMERKLKNIREVIWFFAIIFDVELVFIFELLAIGISCKIINNLKNKMGIPTSVFSKDDYTVYEDYWKHSENEEAIPYQADFVEEETDDTYTMEREYGYDDIIDGEQVRMDVSEEKVERFDFNKPVGEMGRIEPLKTTTSMDFNVLSLETENAEKTEPGADEIRCEKCGTIMAKTKIACPKCGTLVKGIYRTGR